MSAFTLGIADADGYPALIPDLAAILKACVDGGAGVHFLAPLALERAEAFWHETAPAIATGARRLYFAEADGRVLGTVQLVLGQPENGPHRAEVSKMLVHPAARRRGIARALLDFAEQDARREGKTLLFLDSVPDGAPEALYRRAGFRRIGLIPDFAVYADGGRTATAILYKRIDRPAITVRPVEAAGAEVQALMQAQTETLHRLVEPSGRPAYDPAADAADPRAVTLLAEIDGVAVGCGALRPIDATTAEMKRLYAAPDTHGVGHALVTALEDFARASGFTTMQVETRTGNRRGVSFYIGCGYIPCPSYGAYIGRTDATCFDKPLLPLP